ncbi:GTPase Era [Gammaproteobacteria bacterium]|nr:GTPase Era [Gammaproteobacteria bacterium]
MTKTFRICFTGRPNVGKSTLTNLLLKVPLAIESPKPQTTWYAVRGLLKKPQANFILTDTPGIHQLIHREQNKRMNKIAHHAMMENELICHMITPPSWREEDEHIRKMIQTLDKPCILLVNQVDRFKPSQLLPFMEYAKAKGYAHILPISAKTGLNVDLMIEDWLAIAPQTEHPHLINLEYTEAFLAQEMVREQLMLNLASEMPYSTYIEIFRVKQEEKRLLIDVNLHVKHIGQKKIVIGDNGAMIKKIGETARKRLQNVLKKRIMLKTWVKVNPQLSENRYIDQYFDN